MGLESSSLILTPKIFNERIFVVWIQLVNVELE
jgi:hypothetical protein